MQMTAEGDLTPTLLDEDQVDLAIVSMRRLSTDKGMLLSAPDEETIDLRNMLSSELPPGQAGFGFIRSQATGALLADPRIFSVEISGTLSDDGHSLSMFISGIGSTGPFALTLNVSQLTVSMLRSG